MTLPIDREEVARALFDAMTGDLVFWENTVKAKKVKALAGADAAIANIMGQLQEPSPAMINAGIDYALSSSLSGPGTWPKYITGLYKAMIAEALKEPSND